MTLTSGAMYVRVDPREAADSLRGRESQLSSRHQE